MKKIILAAALAAALNISYEASARPLAAFTGISAATPRAVPFALNTGTHIGSILDSAGIYELVNAESLKEQLNKFACTDEKCVLRFSENAGISLVISGSLEDMGETMLLRLTAYSTDFPYNGRAVYTRSAELKTPPGLTTYQSAGICEENAALFIAGLFRKLRTQAEIYVDGTLSSSGPPVPDGTYRYFIKAPDAISGLTGFSPAGNIEIAGGRVHLDYLSILKPGGFIFISHDSRADRIENFYYGRKHEMVFSRPTIERTAAGMLLAPVGSALMPIAAPLFGHYEYKDWTGLALWAANASPYLYLEADGFINRPSKLKDRGEDISLHRAAAYRFAWYMLLAGGTSLFVDAFAHQSLQNASVFGPPQSYTGSSFMAGYLSLVSGGGGHFYRGSRSWGYFYFHLNNILVYAALRDFSAPEKLVDGQYVRGSTNKDRGYKIAAVYGAVKIVEIVHAVLSKDRIASAENIQEDFTVLPYLSFSEDSSPFYGLSLTKRF